VNNQIIIIITHSRKEKQIKCNKRYTIQTTGITTSQEL